MVFSYSSLYKKSRPNRKLIYNSIMNGPYVRRMIPEPSDSDREVPVNETFHEQTNEELTENELKQVEADDQAIQSILLDLPKDIYVAVDSCETAQEIWLRVQQMMKGSDIEVNELRAERLARTHDPLALMANSNNPYNYLVFHQDQPSSVTYMQQPMINPEHNSDPTTVINMALVLITKAFKLNYSTPTNNNKRISSNPCNRQITQPGMNIGQDRQMQMVGGNGRNHFRQYAGQNVGNQNSNGAMVLSQKGSMVGRGVKEKQVSSADNPGGTLNDAIPPNEVVAPAVSDEPIAMEMKSPVVDKSYAVDSDVGSYPPLPTQ
ncbi:hypothetical protein Tco_1241189, partial [Tanacetum coccineum]